MSSRTRSLLTSGVAVLVLFVAGLAAGYVYRYAPARDTVEVRVTSDAEPGVRTVSGTVSAVEAGRMTIATASGPVTVTIPAGTAAPPVEQLVHAPEGVTTGARVNVGVLSTRYGLVLTGVVAVEGAR